MLLSRLKIMAVCLLLASCGFQPLYAPQNNVAAATTLSDIEVRNIPNREGQMLRNFLIDRIYTQGRPENARFVLHINRVEERIARLGIKKDASATRAQMEVSIQMALIDRQTNKVVLRRDLRSVNSFNILESQYTINVSEDDARKRALKDLSNSVTTQLMLHFKRNPA